MKRLFILLLLFLFHFIYCHQGIVHEELIKKSLPVLGTTFNYGNDILKKEVQDEDKAPDYIYTDTLSENITVTHFWDQDYNFPDGEGLCNHTAYEKAIEYWERCGRCALDISGTACCGINKDIFFEYDRDFESDTGDFVSINGQILWVYGGYLWRLGRISHLLEDMNVPAHVHNDEHTTNDDEYKAIFIQGV